MIGCSALDEAWIDQVSALQDREVLFLAEGLFMYLEKSQVVELFGKLAARFSSSEIVFEVVKEMYARGILKKMVESKMKRKTGTDAGASYNYGVKDAREVEGYSDHIEVVDEWSYFEEPDVRPGFMRWFRHWKFVARTLWTIRARIGKQS